MKNCTPKMQVCISGENREVEETEEEEEEEKEDAERKGRIGELLHITVCGIKQGRGLRREKMKRKVAPE